MNLQWNSLGEVGGKEYLLDGDRGERPFEPWRAIATIYESTYHFVTGRFLVLFQRQGWRWGWPIPPARRYKTREAAKKWAERRVRAAEALRVLKNHDLHPTVLD